MTGLGGTSAGVRRLPGASRRSALLISAVGAAVSTLSIGMGSTPMSVLDAIDGNSLSLVVVFIAILAGGHWVLTRVPLREYRWALPFALLMSVAELAGISLRRAEGDLGLITDGSAWAAIHWMGTAYLLTLACALGFFLAGAYRVRRAPAERATSRPARFLGSLRGPSPWSALAALYGVLVAIRLPLLIWWPGVVAFDTFRSIGYLDPERGLSATDPLSYTFIVWLWMGVWDALGLTPGGAALLAAVMQILFTSAALTFLLWRIAVWGIGSRMWWASVAWICFAIPIAAYSIIIVKDIPFLIAFLVFMVVLMDLLRAVVRGEAGAAWMWWTLGLSALLTIVTRNNGVYFMLPSLLLLLIPLRSQWKRMVAVVLVSVAGYGVYVGPLYSALHVYVPSNAEAWSIPMQQIARIVKDHGDELSAQDRRFLAQVFPGWETSDFVENYVPEISDRIKGKATETWRDQDRVDVLRGWWHLARQYPRTATVATLANTMGYWAPGARSFDGIFELSAREVRGVRFEFPSSHVDPGSVQEYLWQNQVLRSRERAVPVLQEVPVWGMTLSPAIVNWGWAFAGVVLVRKRAWTEASFLIPGVILLATLLAGPVSGGMRYSLGYYVVLPAALAMALLARDRREPASGSGAGRAARREA